MNVSEYWCLCWSGKQNALHVEPLAKHLQLNRNCFANNDVGDFRILEIGSRDQISAAAESARTAVMEREGNRVRRML